jgi:hypothetical protein
VSFFVLQNDYFQDDLFSPTKVLWEPYMTASQWFGGANIPPKRMDLKPNDMETRKSFDFAAPPHHQIRAQKITTGNKYYPLICLFLFSTSLVSSLKAQSTAPPIIELIVSDTKRRRRHRWLPKECEKGSLAIPTKSPNLYLFSSVV